MMRKKKTTEVETADHQNQQGDPFASIHKQSKASKQVEK